MLSNVKLYLSMGLVGLVGLLICALIYYYKDNQLNKQETKIYGDANQTLYEEAKKDDASNTVTNEIQKDHTEKDQTISKQQSSIIDKLDAKVKENALAPDLTKIEANSESRIDAIWEAYCLDNTDAQCVKEK